MSLGHISILISCISAAVASIVLYHSYLKPAKIGLLPAERVAFWHDNEGRFCADVPLVVSNEGSKAGVVHSMALIIKNKKIENESFFLKWDWFLKYNPQTHSWDVDGFPFPIAIRKSETIFKYVQFFGGDESKNWIPQPGEFEIVLLGWSKAKAKPDIHRKFEIEIDAKIFEFINANFMGKTKNSNYIYRKELKDLLPKKLTKSDFDNLAT